MSWTWRWPVGANGPDNPSDDRETSPRVVPIRPQPRSEPDVADVNASMLDPTFDVAAHCREEIAFAMRQVELDRSSVPAPVPFAEPDPTAERDRLALLDEQAFRKRFWFKVGEAQRAKILAFKKTTGVTDGEIALLWWTDSLDTGGPSVRLAASRVKYLRGYAVLSVFSVLSLTIFAHMIFVPAPTAASLAARLLAFVFCIVVWCAAMIIDIRPYAICMRLQKEADQAAKRSTGPGGRQDDS